MMETIGIFGTLGVMILTMFLILIPSVPVSALQWTIVMLYGAFTGFERFTLWAALFATLFMILGSTSSFWMPLFGLRGRQISCMGMIAFFIGMIVGSIVIPIPFLGTIIGAVIGVVLVEYTRFGEWEQAIQSGGSALKLIIFAMIAELVFSSAIIGTFLVSIVMTTA